MTSRIRQRKHLACRDLLGENLFDSSHARHGPEARRTTLASHLYLYINRYRTGKQHILRRST